MPWADNDSFVAFSVISINHLLPLLKLFRHFHFGTFFAFLFRHHHCFLTGFHKDMSWNCLSTASANLITDLESNQFIFGHFVELLNYAIMHHSIFDQHFRFTIFAVHMIIFTVLSTKVLFQLKLREILST